MKPNPMAAPIASPSPINAQARANGMAAGGVALPPAWSRGSAPASSPLIPGQPKPHGANPGPKHEPGSHRAVSSAPQPRPRPMPDVPPHAAAPAEASVSTSPGLGTRLANAFEDTKEEVVSDFKERPIHNLIHPGRSLAATIGAFIWRLVRPSK